MMFADIDECTEGTDACGDVCENIIGSYHCRCSRQGYQLLPDGTTCQSEPSVQIASSTLIIVKAFFLFTDIDECSDGSHNCAQNCTDTDGSYNCSCRSGFRLANDSHQCDGTSKLDNCTSFGRDIEHRCTDRQYFTYSDINECVEGIDGCGQFCYNSIGSYSCGCSPCYTLSTDGRSCYGEYYRCLGVYLHQIKCEHTHTNNIILNAIRLYKKYSN